MPMPERTPFILAILKPDRILGLQSLLQLRALTQISIGINDTLHEFLLLLQPDVALQLVGRSLKV
jgi:hypothetical protein